MLISAIVIVAYTTLGGFLAASTTDFVQSIVMTIAIVVVFGFGISKVGSFSAVMDNAKSMAGYFSLTHTHDVATGTASPYSLLQIFSTLAWGLGYFGMPHVLLRFMAIGDANKLKLSRRVATVWVVISMAVSVFIGVIGNAMTKAGVLPTLKDPETIILVVADLISKHGVLATIIAGLILAGILAATMSTADSQLLAASSSASQNILKEVFMKDMSEKTGMLIARITVLVIALIGVFIARNPDSSVFQIVSFAWLGTIVHRSCLIILPFLLIYLFRRSRIIAKSCLVILPIAFLFRGQLTVMASSIFENLGFELEQYGGGSGGLTTFLVYLLLFVWGMFFTYIGEADYELQPLWLSMMGVATVLQVFVLVNSYSFVWCGIIPFSWNYRYS